MIMCSDVLFGGGIFLLNKMVIDVISFSYSRVWNCGYYIYVKVLKIFFWNICNIVFTCA